MIALQLVSISNPQHLIISNDNFTGGVDYNSGPYNVIFPAGVTSVSFNIIINNDTVLEYNETFNLTIINGSLPKNFIVGEIYITEVTILSDGSSGTTTNIIASAGSSSVVFICTENIRIYVATRLIFY